MQIRFSWVMPSAAGGHKLFARDISPCQSLASVVNSIVPCTCASTLSFINDKTMFLPFLSPFHFWISNNFGFILTLHKANANLKGIQSVLPPCKQWAGSTEINLSCAAPCRFACYGGQTMWRREGNAWGHHGQESHFYVFLGFVASHPFSPRPLIQ